MSSRCPKCQHKTSGTEKFCTECGGEIDADPMIGQMLLGQYKILKKLGQGGFGCVYEADQPSVSRKVAVKTLHKHLTSDRMMVTRFRREGVASSRLDHPASVKVHNFGETDDGILWLAMEFLEGQTLDQFLLERRKISTKELLTILKPICELLQEAHTKGIVHRDLKPENIMIMKSPPLFPKILDFGLASLMESNDNATQTGMVSGTPRYMSPEQWKGLKYTDHRADLYALGVLVYQCLSGRLPFEADTGPAWMMKHCAEAPLDLEIASANSVSSPVKHAVMKSLAKEPAHRYQTAMEFYNSVEEALLKNPSDGVTMQRHAYVPPGTMPTMPAGLSGKAAPVEETILPYKKNGFSFNLSLGKFKIALSLAFMVLGGIVILPLLNPSFEAQSAEPTALVKVNPSPEPDAVKTDPMTNANANTPITQEVTVQTDDKKPEEKPANKAEPSKPSAKVKKTGKEEPKEPDLGPSKAPDLSDPILNKAPDPKPEPVAEPAITPPDKNQPKSGLEATETNIRSRIKNIATKCFKEEAFEAAPAYSGKITISSAGKVAALEVSANVRLIGGKVEKCMINAIRGLKMQPTPDGKDLKFSF